MRLTGQLRPLEEIAIWKTREWRQPGDITATEAMLVEAVWLVAGDRDLEPAAVYEFLADKVFGSRRLEQVHVVHGETKYTEVDMTSPRKVGSATIIRGDKVFSRMTLIMRRRRDAS